MNKIAFLPINETNQAEVKRIKLKSGQENFIESVEECLAEAAQYPAWQPVAVYHDHELIGFAMYGSFGPNRDTWIDRIIIDEKHQGKGLGRKAMEQLIDVVANVYQVDQIFLSIVPENEVAYRLYESIGFKSINEKDPNGEEIFRYKR